MSQPHQVYKRYQAR